MKHKISNAALYIVGMPHLMKLLCLMELPCLMEMSHLMEMPRLVLWKLLFPRETWAFKMRNITCCHVCPRMEKWSGTVTLNKFYKKKILLTSLGTWPTITSVLKMTTAKRSC